MTPLAERLRMLRRQHGWTIRQLADRVQCTNGYISRIESKDVPSPDFLCSIARVFNVPPEELLFLLKQVQLSRVEQEIDLRHQSALAKASTNVAA